MVPVVEAGARGRRDCTGGIEAIFVVVAVVELKHGATAVVVAVEARSVAVAGIVFREAGFVELDQCIVAVKDEHRIAAAEEPALAPENFAR